MTPGLTLSYGSHSRESEGCCLLEACSLPPGMLPVPGVFRTDHPPYVCSVRAAFGRMLNDSYGAGDEADRWRTEDLLPLVEPLIGTARREDQADVARYLSGRYLRQWFPKLFLTAADALEGNGEETISKGLRELSRSLEESPEYSFPNSSPAHQLAELVVDLSYLNSHELQVSIVVACELAKQYLLTIEILSATTLSFTQQFHLLERAIMTIRRSYDYHKVLQNKINLITREFLREQAEALLETCRWSPPPRDA